MAQATPKLGDVAASELLITDLYLSLRRKTRFWAGITKQTAQARMGYIGQHLVSVATGCPGGKSGARGRDIIHTDGSSGEIKTCYRVDQLGKCTACGSGVAPDEKVCSECGSADIERKDDSKWLLSFRNETEFLEMLVPSVYYLVLFEFTDLAKPDTIRASIWTVNPKVPGFLLCMVDYYLNTRAGSKSKAPFNWWPYSLKFELMRPQLIYQSIIQSDDTIKTVVFPGRNAAAPHPLSSMSVHVRAHVDAEIWAELAATFGGKSLRTRTEHIAHLETIRQGGKYSNDAICDAFARLLYGHLVTKHLDVIPKELQGAVRAAMKPEAPRATPR